MAKIKEKVFPLFEQGKSPEEVFEILSEEGVETSISTIRNYYTAWRRGFDSYSRYWKYILNEKRAAIIKRAFELFDDGKSPEEVFRILSRKGIQTSKRTIENYYYMWKNNGNLDKSEKPPKRFMDDPNFREIYQFGICSESNPYVLWRRWLEDKDEEAREWVIRNIPKDMSIFEKMRYIGKLAEGIEWLEKHGKI